MARKDHHDFKAFPSEFHEPPLTDRHIDAGMRPRQQGDYGTGARERHRTNARYNLRPAPTAVTGGSRPSTGPGHAEEEDDLPPSSGRQTTADREEEPPLSCPTWGYDTESRQTAASYQPPDRSEGYWVRKRPPQLRTTSGHFSLADTDSGHLPLTSPETAEEEERTVKRAGVHKVKKRKQ